MATISGSKPNVSRESRTNDNRVLLRALAYLKPYWRISLGTYLCAIAINILAIFIPQTIRWVIDVGITQQQSNLIIWGVGILLGLTVVKGILGFLLGKWSEVASQYVAYDLRNAIFRKLSELSFSYHDRSETGQLLTRSIQDVERIRFLTGRAMLRLFQTVTLFVVTFIALLLTNVQLGLLSVLTMPFLGYVSYLFGKRYRPLSLAIQEKLSTLTTVLEQNLRGSRIVKAFAQEDSQIRYFEKANEQWFEESVAGIRVQARLVPLIEFFANLSTVIIIWYGGALVMQEQVTFGELVAFTTYLAQLVNPVRRFGIIITAIAMASASSERIFEILDAKSEVEEAPDAVPLPQIKGHVALKDVSFAYFGTASVLKNISLDVQPAQIVAILGTTGSGKSTIINLLPRFYDPTEGSILIDGHDIRMFTLNSLRDQIGIVLQETTLFAASIYENIVFGASGATREDVIAAAKAAQAHDFIMGFSDGYETLVGERGVTLSGGQKQRVAIARTLLKNPRILLLDDATSSVDTETEHLIQVAIEKLMEGRTSFIIAQRLSTVRIADHIIVLDKGQIVAQGHHDDLIQQSGLYAEIYRRNLR